jgi:predicted amidohydrolase
MRFFTRALPYTLFGLLSACASVSALRAEEPKTTLRVATAQIPVTRDIERNAETIERAIGEAIANKAHILLTPEGSLSGYTPKFDQAEVEANLKRLVRKASEAKLALALGTCFVEPDDGKCYNQIRLIPNSPLSTGGNW